MNSIDFLKIYKLWIIIALLGMMQPVVANWQADVSELRGKAFSNPSYTVPLPEKWQKQSINYPASFGQVDLAIALNQQLIPHLAPLIKEFAKQKGLKIKVLNTTCGSAAGHMNNKRVDIASFCCPAGKIDRLPGIQFHTLGIHPVVFFVHPDNPVEGVTLAQLRQIYQGDIEHWSVLGGHQNKIEMAGPLHCKKRPGHWKLMLSNEDEFSPKFLNLGMSDSVKQPALNRQIISFESLLSAQRFWKDMDIAKSKIKALKVNGYSPEDANNLLNGNYPLYRVYNFTTWEGNNLKNKHASELISYLMNEVEKGKGIDLLSAAKLRKAGWKFKGNELIGEPELN
jgi:phosphate transport system substrate-binding protein